MNFSLVHSIWTVMLFMLFIGIIVWAWSAKRKPRFDEAARLPLEDEDSAPAHSIGDNTHG